jgi:hypothetical protein
MPSLFNLIINPQVKSKPEAYCCSMMLIVISSDASFPAASSTVMEKVYSPGVAS